MNLAIIYFIVHAESTLRKSLRNVPLSMRASSSSFESESVIAWIFCRILDSSTTEVILLQPRFQIAQKSPHEYAIVLVDR